MRALPTAFVACLLAAPCLAQEPVGCDKFKWPLDQERAMLGAAAMPAVASGANLAKPPPLAVALTLVAFGQANLPLEPERAPKPQTSAGFVAVGAPARPGVYKVSLSDAGWVDVVQAGRRVKSAAFSGVTGCAGIRKSVKFNLAAAPFTVEISGAAANSIRLAITAE